MSSNTKVKLGLIGCGFIAQAAHIPACQKADGVILAAVCDLSEELVRNIQNVYLVKKGYTDYLDMLVDPEVDAVIITVPDAAHLTVAADFLRAGKPVLLEKPLTMTLDEAIQLQQIVDETSGKLQVGFMKRFDPGVQFAQEFIRGTAGKLLTFSGWYCDSVLRSQMQTAWFAPLLAGSHINASSPLVGSDHIQYKLRTHGSHLVDLARFFCGEIGSITAKYSENRGALSWQILVEFTSGCLGTMELILASQMEWLEGFRIHADFGSVLGDVSWPFYRQGAKVRVYNAKDHQYHTPACPDADPYERQIEAFAKAIVEDVPVSPNVVDGLACQRVLDAIYLSFTENKPVEINL